MNRERAAWLISVVLLALLAFELPGSLAQRNDDYDWVRTLVEVHRQVIDNYVEPVNDQDLKEKSIEGMLSVLDPYTVYVAPEKQSEFEELINGEFSGVGITLDKEPDGRILVLSPLEGSPADRAGIEAGDYITKVDGQPTANWLIEDVVKHVTGKAGTKVTLTIERDGKETDYTMTREQIVLPTVVGYDRAKDDSWNYWVCKDPKIAYVRITQFDANTFDSLKGALEGVPPSPGETGKPGLLDSGMKGLILDLRFNPGGRLEQAIQVVNLFVKDGSVIVTTRGRSRPEQINRANGQGTLPDFPMIVLVNEHSASAAEIVSGSLKDNHRALVIGQRTFGKGSVQEVVPLEGDGGELKITVAYYYLPSGRLVHRKKGATDWGVEPQIIVPVDDEGEREIREQMARRDTIRHPTTLASTTPATGPTTVATTAPATTEPVDPQLQQALNTMVGLIFLGEPAPPSTQPSAAAMN
ncbi:MAG: S41 family peptidase [Tepidisphaeraceae bacterium]|jgi:carboxyl-terminal processing protease